MVYTDIKKKNTKNNADGKVVLTNILLLIKQITSEKEEKQHTHTNATPPSSKKRPKIVCTWASCSVVSPAFCLDNVAREIFHGAPCPIKPCSKRNMVQL